MRVRRLVWLWREMMRTRWAGITLVVLVAAGIVVYKHHRSPSNSAAPVQSASAPKPEIILVADLREADPPGDNCAEIIRLVREAGGRGVRVQEFSPESDSPLLKQYRILTNPTVLILDRDGKVVSRYEGESSSTVKEIRDRLASLNEARR